MQSTQPLTHCQTIGPVTKHFSVFSAAAPSSAGQHSVDVGVSNFVVLGHDLTCLFLDLTTHYGWRWCYWINLPLCFVTLITVLVLLRLPRKHVDLAAGLKKVDFPGAFTLMLAITAFVIPTVSYMGSVHCLMPIDRCNW